MTFHRSILLPFEASDERPTMLSLGKPIRLAHASMN